MSIIDNKLGDLLSQTRNDEFDNDSYLHSEQQDKLEWVRSNSSMRSATHRFIEVYSRIVLSIMDVLLPNELLYTGYYAVQSIKYP